MLRTLVHEKIVRGKKRKRVKNLAMPKFGHKTSKKYYQIKLTQDIILE